MFSIRPVRGTGPSISDCGRSSFFGGVEHLHWQWPVPYPFDFEPLPLGKLFGHAARFVVTLVAPGKTLSGAQGPLTAVDIGGPGHADVRFIRVPNVP